VGNPFWGGGREKAHQARCSTVARSWPEDMMVTGWRKSHRCQGSCQQGVQHTDGAREGVDGAGGGPERLAHGAALGGRGRRR
jgi:hypothetical protein